MQYYRMLRTFYKQLAVKDKESIHATYLINGIQLSEQNLLASSTSRPRSKSFATIDCASLDPSSKHNDNYDTSVLVRSMSLAGEELLPGKWYLVTIVVIVVGILIH